MEKKTVNYYKYTIFQGDICVNIENSSLHV